MKVSRMSVQHCAEASLTHSPLLKSLAFFVFFFQLIAFLIMVKLLLFA